MPMPFNECDLFFDSESQIPKRNCQKRIHFFDVSSRQSAMSANLTESPLAARAQRWGAGRGHSASRSASTSGAGLPTRQYWF